MNSNANLPLWQRPLFWFFAALLIRSVYLLEQGFTSVLFYQQLLDEQEFAQQAQRLLAGEGFGSEPFFKAPFYSFVVASSMAVAGEAWVWVLRVFQHSLGAGLAVLVFDSTRRIAGLGKRGYQAAGIAAAAVCFYGPLVRLENRLIADSLSVFLQSAMIWSLIRLATCSAHKFKMRWAFVAGFFAGAAWLTRPTITPLLPVLLLWIAWPGLCKFKVGALRSKRALACAVIFAVLPLCAIAAFAFRNQHVSGEALWLPWQGGYNFYHANRKGVDGRYLHQMNFSNNATGNPTHELMVTGYRQKNTHNKNATAKQINDWWFEQAFSDIEQHPRAWMNLVFYKALYLVSAREIFNFEDFNVQRKLSNILPWLFLNFGIIWPFALVSLLGLQRIQKRRRRLYGLLWLYGIFLAGGIALYFTSGRLRMPLVFPAVILGATGLLHVADLIKQFFEVKRHPRLIPQTALAIAVILLGVFLSWNDWQGVRSEEVRHFEYARLSNAAWQDRQYQVSLDFALKCEEIDPVYPRIAILKGQALYSLGRFGEAAREFGLAAKAMPQDPVAPFNYGILCYYHLNNPEEAARGFQEALRRDPKYEKARWMAARAYVREKEYDKAERLLAPYYIENAPLHSKEFFISATVLYQGLGDEKIATKWMLLLEKNYGSKGINQLVTELKTAGIAFPQRISDIAEIHN